MTRTVVQELSSRLQARLNCIKCDNQEWLVKHTEIIKELEEWLPSGSGFDNGTLVDIERSTPDRVILTTSYHHIDESGGYDGWTSHEVIITPSLAFGFNLRITGSNRNGLKEYAHDCFHLALSAPLDTAKLCESAGQTVAS